MGFGFKYHVVTVAAIFFALTVGLVVGSLLVSPRLVGNQGALIKNLTAEVTADIKDKTQQIDRQHKYLAVTVPALIKGKLNGITVALVQTGGDADTTAHAKDALEQAGAQVISVTTIGRDFDKSDTVLNTALAAQHQNDPRFPGDRAGLADTIANILVKGDAISNGFLPVLEREDYVHIETGSQYITGARYVVIIAGSRSETSERTTNVDAPLVLALQKLGVDPVMCESKDVAYSDVDAYQKLNLVVTTIDDIDSDIGPASLVFSLLGSEKGSYGEKPKATTLYPPELSRIAGR